MTTSRDNPYRWDNADPRILIELPVFEEIRAALLRSKRLVLVGGHGMGKTVLLHWLGRAFDPGEVHVALISTKPTDYSVSGCVRQLARKLGGGDAAPDEINELFDEWFKREGRQLVLLYDEIDRYVDDGDTAKSLLNALATAHESHDKLGIAIAGGLGVYKAEPDLGSTYMARAKWMHITPFERESIIKLAQPFEDDGCPLSDQALDVIEQFSGGNPALVTYALETYWPTRTEIGLDDVFDLPRGFQKEHRAFVRTIYRGLGIGEEHEHDANRLWRYIEMNPGPSSMNDLLGQVNGTSLKLERILELLSASGLIRIRGDLSGSHVDAEVIPSFLRPLEAPAARDTRAEQFHHDMERALRLLSRYQLDLYSDQAHTKLSREAVFSAFLAMQFELSGWGIVTRESQQGPGYVDILLSHTAFRDQPKAVVEVKLETNSKVSEAHRQVLKYYDQGSPDEQCMAVVVIAGLDKSDEEWRQSYRGKCLPGQVYELKDLEVAPPVPHGFRAHLRGDAGRGVWVSHYLLNLRRRNA
jgi:hypothetical protein